MRKFLVISFLLIVVRISSQITLINTGTTEHLYSFSKIGNNILIGGTKTFLVKCYNDCNSLIPLTVPVFTNNTYQFTICRPDSNTLYLSAGSANQNFVCWKSGDGGLNWSKKFDTTTSSLEPVSMGFFDSLHGIVACSNYKVIHTNNGFNTYSVNPSNCNYPSGIATFGDSTTILAYQSGGAEISNNRGYTWSVANGISLSLMDMSFYNKDTALCISNVPNPILPINQEACFQKSFDGGNNWACKVFSGNANKLEFHLLRLCVKSLNDIYILARSSLTGNTYNGPGVILKSMDMGQTWLKYTTPFIENFYGMKFLNDSIALICGSNGLLFKWNSKTTVFTDVKETSANELHVTVFPNPAKDKLQIQFSNLNIDVLRLNISNVLGEVNYSASDIKSAHEIDLSLLQSGIYFINIESKNGTKAFKIVKE